MTTTLLDLMRNNRAVSAHDDHDSDCSPLVSDSETGATVQSVSPVGRDAAEFTVTFDIADPITLTATVLADWYLRPGKHLEAGELAQLRGADTQQRAVEAVMRLVGSRPRSTREITEYLRGKEYAPETITAAIERLTSRGYLDDVAFAQWWTENRTQFRPRGPNLLRQELRQKGIAGAAIDAALAAQAETSDVDAQALALVRGKMRSLSGYPPEVVTRRLSGLLARRGYGYDTVRAVLRVLRDEGAFAGNAAADDDTTDDEDA